MKEVSRYQKILDLKLALRTKLKSVPEGIVVIKTNQESRISHVFDEVAEELKELGKTYVFLFAPYLWDGIFNEQNIEVLRKALAEYDEKRTNS